MVYYLLVLLLHFLVTCSGFNSSTYEHSQEILPRYKVYWNVNQEDASLYLALQVQTTGWVGFGIAEITSGSMPGSDIVLGYVKDGVGTITDRYATQFALPEIDECQDWKLVSAEESDGYTILEVSRLLDTKDSQDRAIVTGPNRIVVAFGENGIDTPGYHSANRITSEITFYGESDTPPLPPDTKFVDLRMPNFTVPSGITNYVCQAFSLPVDQKYSAIQIDPLVDERNIAHVHHFIAHICSNTTDGYVTKYAEPGDCLSPMGDINSGCDDILMAWAAGGGPAILPLEAGFAIGDGPTSAKFVVLEIHYNNPDGIGGYIDTSGIRIWYTDQLRKYEAGIIVVGDPGVYLPPIPALSITEYETECPSVCTQQIAQDLNIWSSFPHMHQHGQQIWTTQWRNDELIAEIGKIEFWSFDHQQNQFVNLTLKPGDRLNTHCIMDTTTSNNIVRFGYNSSDEMCMHFIGYYPRTPEGTFICGYATPNITMCGDGWMEYNNPTIFDPKGEATRDFGVSSKKCPTEPTESQASKISMHFYLFFILICFVFVV